MKFSSTTFVPEGYYLTDHQKYVKFCRVQKAASTFGTSILKIISKGSDAAKVSNVNTQNVNMEKNKHEEKEIRLPHW